MVMDYVKTLYRPAIMQYRRLKENNSTPAKELALWKTRINRQWHNISIERIDDVQPAINDGESLTIKVKAFLNGLSPEDVAVECIVGAHYDHDDNDHEFDDPTCYLFDHAGEENGFHLFTLNLQPNNSGLNYYKMRIFPYHNLLSHPLETGFMIWL
jgi:starch phosphorylase